MSTVGGSKGPTGTIVNCNTWAEYESPGTSAAANLCNGGRFEGAVWSPCPSRIECRKATFGAQDRQNVVPASRVIASTHLNRNRWGQPHTGATSLATRRPDPEPSVGIRKVMPGVLAEVVDMGSSGHSPVFLPMKGEGTFMRTAKNMGQGAIAAMFFHGLAMAQSVDFFPHHQEEDE